MLKKLEHAADTRKGWAMLLCAALVTAPCGGALAQSSTTPPPTAPSADPTNGAPVAPASPSGGQGAGAGAPATADDATKPLQNATTPPGITKPGQ